MMGIRGYSGSIHKGVIPSPHHLPIPFFKNGERLNDSCVCWSSGRNIFLSPIFLSFSFVLVAARRARSSALSTL